MEVTRIAATEMGSGLVPRVSGEEGKTDRDQQGRHDADARRRQKDAIDAEVVIGEPAHGGGKANGELRRRDGEPSGKLRLVGEEELSLNGPAYRGKAERESPENSQRDADVRVPLGEKQGERGGCEGQMDQNHG